jgi:hypothetical protein
MDGFATLCMTLNLFILKILKLSLCGKPVSC